MMLIYQIPQVVSGTRIVKTIKTFGNDGIIIDGLKFPPYSNRTKDW